MVPNLELLRLDVVADAPTASDLLRNAPPFKPLRMRRLAVNNGWDGEASVEALAASVGKHAALRELALHEAPLETAPAWDAIVDAAISRRLTALRLADCSLSPASTPGLARLLTDAKSLVFLAVHNNFEPLFTDAANAAPFCSALRASSLATLVLAGVELWAVPNVGSSIIEALVGHPTMQNLALWCNYVQPADRERVGGLLASLVSSPFSALDALDVACCDLGPHGLKPFFEGLAAPGCRLRSLTCDDNDATARFARDCLLPAIKQNASLRYLKASSSARAAPAVAEAERMVQSRGGVSDVVSRP